MRAPEQPIGCPNAIAPPQILTFSSDILSFLETAKATEAKASLISYTSISFAFRFALSRAALMAPYGAVVNQAGSWQR